MTSEIVSFGGGVNSVAMVIKLVLAGWRGPIVFADTGGELPGTYRYIIYFGRWLAKFGLEIITLSPATHPHLYKDKQCVEALTLENYCLTHGVIPLLTKRWCTQVWKVKPIKAWVKENDITLQLLGISASEPQRVRDDPRIHYPLVKAGIHRSECFRIIQRAGLDAPIKSGCFFCPGASLASMRRLYYDHPDLYKRNIALEDNASKHAQSWATLDPHQISYRQHAKRRWAGQTQMDLSEWVPCVCKP